MAVRNLQVKEKNVGINGQVIMFYSCRRIDSPVAKPRTSPFEKVQEKEITPKIATKHTQLMEDLEALGIDGVKADEVDAAIRKCFPEGTGDVSGDGAPGCLSVLEASITNISIVHNSHYVQS